MGFFAELLDSHRKEMPFSSAYRGLLRPWRQSHPTVSLCWTEAESTDKQHVEAEFEIYTNNGYSNAFDLCVYELSKTIVHSLPEITHSNYAISNNSPPSISHLTEDKRTNTQKPHALYGKIIKLFCCNTLSDHAKPLPPNRFSACRAAHTSAATSAARSKLLKP